MDRIHVRQAKLPSFYLTRLFKNGRRVIFGALLLYGIGLPLQAAETVKLSSAELAKVKPLLCDSETQDQLKVINQTCQPEYFEVWSNDLNGDGKPEWLFFGPTALCGAHGNCPFVILKKVGDNWDFLSKPPCKSNDCLGWANELGTEVLPTKHQGYRDLRISEDSGSFYWTKVEYQWDGAQYKAKPNSTTYYLADSNGKLRKVTKSRWEECSKNGKNCF